MSVFPKINQVGKAPVTLSVNHIATYGSVGGAARAVSNLNQALLAQGIRSRLSTGESRPPEKGVKRVRMRLARTLDRRVAGLIESRQPPPRSLNLWSTRSAPPLGDQSEIVNLHWVGDGYQSLRQIRSIPSPLVWSFYDLWPISATSHYPIDQHSRSPLARMIMSIKREIWDRPDVVGVVPSQWVFQRALDFGIPHQKLRVIPHCFDGASWVGTDEYRNEMRRGTGVYDYKFLLIANEVERNRKGVDVAINALQHISGIDLNPHLLIVGKWDHVPYVSPSVNITFTGPVSPGNLQSFYLQADALLLPSRRDALPLAGIEAQAHGLPVIAIPDSGAVDLISTGITGFCSELGTAESLASAMLQAIEIQWDRDVISSIATQRYSPEVVARQYIDLYHSLVP